MQNTAAVHLLAGITLPVSKQDKGKPEGTLLLVILQLRYLLYKIRAKSQEIITYIKTGDYMDLSAFLA